MKDPVFEGEDLQAAVAQAAATTGIEAAALRYVVLEPGSAALPGQPGRRARIAVLLSAAPPVSSAAPAPRTQAAPSSQEPESTDAAEAVRRRVLELGEAAGLKLEASLETGPETSVLRITGGDDFLLQDDAEPLRALEHLLQRAYGDALPGRLVLDVAGYRGARESQIQSQARAWAEEVRRTGQPRETPPMNAYDRRLIHMALAEEPGLRTFSVGEGSRRRVTIAPAEPTP
jgi:spoIIIJ-associated protein